MSLSLRYAALTDVGRTRKHNQDSGYAGHHLLVIADGMGGAAAGDVASATAVQTLRRLDVPPQADLLETLAGAIHRANERLNEIIEDDPSTDGMGTTVTAALFDGQRIGLAHLGDSRGYLYRDGHLTRITRDHTFVQGLIDEGRITEDEAQRHPHRSLLLRVLQGNGDSDPDLSVIEMRAGDRILLASDGIVAGEVSDDTIERVLSRGTPEAAVIELVQLALQGGGTDNITCLVADLVEEPPDDTEPIVLGAAEEQTRGHLGLRGRRLRIKDTGEIPAVDADLDPEELRYAPRPPGRYRWVRRLVLVAVVVGLFAAGGRWAYDWSQSQYYVGVDSGQVAIFRGVQADLPGIDLSHVYEPENITLTALPDYPRQRVSDGIEADDLDHARSIVADLRQIAAECASTPPTTSPTTSPSTPATQPASTASSPTKTARTPPPSGGATGPRSATQSNTSSHQTSVVPSDTATTPTSTGTEFDPTGSDCAGVTPEPTP
jgi:serine/threonine protein phosphatase PrpC